jgi:hypothetical protein
MKMKMRRNKDIGSLHYSKEYSDWRFSLWNLGSETIRWICLLLTICITGCASVTESVEESTRTEMDDDEFTLQFGLTIPDATNRATTRAFGETIDAKNASVKLVLFDENHLLTNAYEGSYLSTVNGYNYYTVTMKLSDKKRIIHVIVNDNDLDIQDIPYGLESDLFSSTLMAVDQGVDAYWGRVEVDKIDEESTAEALKKLRLVRNFAKVTLTLKDEALEKLTDVQWGIMGAPAKGSVAPYLSGQNFADYFQGDDANASSSYEQLYNQGYCGNIPRTSENADTFYTLTTESEESQIEWKSLDDPIYLFENEGNSSNSLWQKTGFIVRAKYNKSSSYCYYRIAPVDADRNYETLNILRNLHYKLSITNVAAAGYSSATEAYSKAAMNNISGSAETSIYNYVSLDDQVLNVEYVKKYILSPADFTLSVRYIPDVTSTNSDNEYVTDNSKVTLAYASPYNSSDDGQGSMPAFTGSVSDGFSVASYEVTSTDDDYRTFTFHPNIAPTGGRSVTSSIRVAVDGMNTLYRDIEFILRQRYLLQNMQIIKDIEAENADDTDEENCFTLTVDIPSNLPDEIFPLEFTLETYPACIYPNVKKSNMEVEGNQDSYFEENTEQTYHFHRRVSKDEFKNVVTKYSKGGMVQEGGYKKLSFFFKMNAAVLESSGHTIKFGVYCDSFSSHPDEDIEKAIPQMLQSSFTFTNSNGSYSLTTKE